MNQEEILYFISSVPAFTSLEDDQLKAISRLFKAQSFHAGEMLLQENEPTEIMHIIKRGKVQIRRTNRRKPQKLGTLSPLDMVGVRSLLKNKPSEVSVYATSEVQTLSLSEKHLRWLIKTFPKVKRAIIKTLSREQFQRKSDFGWLFENESIQKVARKHIAVLWLSLSLPVVALVIVTILALFAYFNTITILIYICASLGFLIVAWAIWKAIDWRNDHYIITDKRVLWSEKVVALYNSHQEAPLNAILSVVVNTDQTQRWLGYGDVIIKTYTGSIEMHDVDNAYAFAEAIEDQMDKQRIVTRISSNETIEQALLERIHPNLANPPMNQNADHNDELIEEEMIYESFAPRVNKGKLLPRLLSMRIKDGDTTTYRKHWLIGIKKTWKPAILGCLFLAGLVWIYGEDLSTRIFSDPIFFLILTLTLGTFFWWLYQFLDWSNDVYLLTVDKIIDIERKPLGREEKKSAPLESVMNLEHTRSGILGLLFNYGDVKINVGATSIMFYHVHKPARIQQDIFDALNTLKLRKEQEVETRNQERLADWLSVYHNDIKDK